MRIRVNEFARVAFICTLNGEICDHGGRCEKCKAAENEMKRRELEEMYNEQEVVNGEV
jgi:hypothetical protein